MRLVSLSPFSPLSFIYDTYGVESLLISSCLLRVYRKEFCDNRGSTENLGLLVGGELMNINPECLQSAFCLPSG